ncbi:MULTISPECIES: C40 family peptidase [unclassified Caballeronia]|uniref:C40 family peptidase n=1 Tax=unclassified Caballeronia TaxID=2646786 RepID=UPI002865C157|nr:MULTISPECIES: C40 family peptidase [unclassified Caballeronia]MDR5750571.1 C40 family peptidase [Caballeronia sp. LZ024]MDR5842396.1 C40 family peptidase [Caballeronia sp. LZ031]
MRRIWFPLLVTLLLAACGSAPQNVSRKPAASSTAARTFPTPSGFPNFVDHSVGREEISIQAMSLVGVPYRWGGNTPEAGFDCSGLVRYVVDRAASVNLPRTTADMSGRGESIEPDEVAPGDLIFFNTTGRPHSHVGIYVGKLRFVNAPSTGGTVRLDYLTNPYWAKRFDGIRRVAPPKSAPTPFDAPTYLASPGNAGPSSTVVDRAEPPTQARVANSAAAAPSDRFEPPAVQKQVLTTGTTVVPRAQSLSASAADQFEPPPSALAAAQRQARAAGAVSPAAVAASSAPDPIAAAADAFEPPPPNARLAAQQARAVQQLPAAEPTARVMPASTSTLAAPRPSAPPADDPIARFATGSE